MAVREASCLLIGARTAVTIQPHSGQQEAPRGASAATHAASSAPWLGWMREGKEQMEYMGTMKMMRTMKRCTGCRVGGRGGSWRADHIGCRNAGQAKSTAAPAAAFFTQSRSDCLTWTLLPLLLPLPSN